MKMVTFQGTNGDIILRMTHPAIGFVSKDGGGDIEDTIDGIGDSYFKDFTKKALEDFRKNNTKRVDIFRIEQDAKTKEYELLPGIKISEDVFKELLKEFPDYEEGGFLIHTTGAIMEATDGSNSVFFRLPKMVRPLVMDGGQIFDYQYLWLAIIV